jgi:hypothetical protein
MGEGDQGLVRIGPGPAGLGPGHAIYKQQATTYNRGVFVLLQKSSPRIFVIRRINRRPDAACDVELCPHILTGPGWCW